EFHALLEPDCPDPEHASHIDKSEAPYLHEMLYKVGPGPHQNLLPLPRNHYNIVRHEPVPPFDEIQGYLALAYARSTDKEQADPVTIDKRSMYDRLWGKLVIQKICQYIDEFRRFEFRLEDGYFMLSRNFEQILIDRVLIGYDHTRYLELEEGLDRRDALFGG